VFGSADNSMSSQKRRNIALVVWVAMLRIDGVFRASRQAVAFAGERFQRPEIGMGRTPAIQ